MHPTVKPLVTTHDAATGERYTVLAFEALLLAVFLCTFTLLSIGLAAGIRKADSLLVPAVHRAVVQPILGNWPAWP